MDEISSPDDDGQVMRTSQTLINIVDFGMNIQEDRSTALGYMQLSRFAIPAHHESWRPRRGIPDPGSQATIPRLVGLS